MQQYRPTGFKLLPTVVKNLLIINGLFFLAQIGIQHSMRLDLTDYLGIYYIGSENFQPYQFITYMFMHGGFGHLFFNMFALWMFGYALENIWGPKRFLTYYLVTGVGAAVIQIIVTHIQISSASAGLSSTELKEYMTQGAQYLREGKNYVVPALAKLNLLYNIPTVGASGAVFGILLAFGMTFPNTYIYVYFAFPIKAKYFVIIYGALELLFGVANRAGDNVAHFAHLGGMIFGYFLIRYWNSKLNKRS